MNWKIYGLVHLLFFALLLFFLPHTGYEGDMMSWWMWAEWIQDMGMARIYETSVNYHPVWLYGLYIYGALQSTKAEIAQNVNWIKVAPLLFDFLCAYTVFFFVRFEPKQYIKPFFLLFNLAFLYNSMIWGQVDSIPTFFMAMSIIYALKEKISWSLIFFVLAIYTKLQAIIFLPLLGLMLLPAHIQKPQRFVSSLLVLGLTQVVILWPYILAGTVSEFWAVVVGAVGHHPQISMSAFNFWQILYLPELDPGLYEDTLPLWGMTAKSWGFLFFFSSSAIVLFPLLRETFLQLKTRKVSSEFAQMVWLSAAQITLLFFFFNTQMHERYAHSALLFLFLFGLLKKNYFLYILCSIAYFLNMEKVLQALPVFSHHTLIFDPRFVAWLYAIIIVVATVRLYQIAFQKEERVAGGQIMIP